MIPVAPSSSNMWRIYCESSGPKSALLTKGSGKQNNHKIRKRKGRKKQRKERKEEGKKDGLHWWFTG